MLTQGEGFIHRSSLGLHHDYNLNKVERVCVGTLPFLTNVKDSFE